MQLRDFDPRKKYRHIKFTYTSRYTLMVFGVPRKSAERVIEVEGEGAGIPKTWGIILLRNSIKREEL